MIRKGINYFYYPRDIYGRIPQPTKESPRVFISHQKKDSSIARRIADYLIEAGVDIYFDQLDAKLDRSNPESVVNAIRTGIENSSHMLVVFSSNTFDSMWVPWEIGYAYNSQISLNVLRIKGVAKDKLPEYLKVVNLILDIWDLNQFISNVTSIDSNRLLLEGRIRLYSDSQHPLKQDMELI